MSGELSCPASSHVRRAVMSGDKSYYLVIIDPRHDKTNKVTVRPVKTQISLGIRPV